MGKQRSVHDWSWRGSVFGVPVMRHGHVHVRLFGGRVVARTAQFPRWHVRLPGFEAAWWPRDPVRLALRLGKWWVR